MEKTPLLLTKSTRKLKVRYNCKQLRLLYGPNGAVTEIHLIHGNPGGNALVRLWKRIRRALGR